MIVLNSNRTSLRGAKQSVIIKLWLNFWRFALSFSHPERSRRITIPESWQELTPAQYLDTIRCIDQSYITGDDITTFRLKLLSALTGYQRSKKKFTEEQQEQINSNLIILSEMLTFTFKPRYLNPEVLDVVSDELYNLLQKKFPFEIFEEKHHGQLEMIRPMLKYSVQIAYTMKRNPLSEIVHNKTKLTGPRFDIDKNGAVTTDITVGEFLDAQEFTYLYEKTGDPEYLKSLTAVLYRFVRKPFDKQTALNCLPYIETIDPIIPKAVYYFFQNVSWFVTRESQFAPLFSHTTDSESSSFNPYDTVFNMIKNGYGSKNDLLQYTIDDYFSIILKQTRDTIAELKAYKKTDGEICDALKINFETLQKLMA